VSSFQSILFSGKLIWELTAFSRHIYVTLLQLCFFTRMPEWLAFHVWLENGDGGSSKTECELAPSTQFYQLNLSVHIRRTHGI